MGRGSPKELVKTHENAKLEKGLRMPKESKWAKDAQEEINGTQEPASNVIKSPMIIQNHWEKNKQQAQKGPVGLGQTTSQ